MHERITPLILTANEEPNLARVLAKLDWARQIVVVDSLSTDATPALAQANPRVKFLPRPFDNHQDQWNYGVDACATDWVLTLDADYVLSDELVRELASVPLDGDVVAYYARFRYLIHGRPLRRTLYPPRAVLFNRRVCRYHQEGHTQILTVPGPSAFLQGTIAHDDRKPLGRWLRARASR
jgi:glycosyltransferase involved in cell wall biosynthesis